MRLIVSDCSEQSVVFLLVGVPLDEKPPSDEWPASAVGCAVVEPPLALVADVQGPYGVSAKDV